VGPDQWRAGIYRSARETSIVFGALIGAVFLGERLGTRRAPAAGVVLAGALPISLT